MQCLPLNNIHVNWYQRFTTEAVYRLLSVKINIKQRRFTLLSFIASANIDNSITYDTYSLSISATLHLYCAVENKQISANWRTVNIRENIYWLPLPSITLDNIKHNTSK